MSKYSPEFKLQVLRHMKQNHLSLREAVAYFDILGGAGVVSKWEELYDEGGFSVLEPRPRGRPPRMKTPASKQTNTRLLMNDEELTQLRKENEHLRAGNAYLKKLDALFQQKEHAHKRRIYPRKSACSR